MESLEVVFLQGTRIKEPLETKYELLCLFLAGCYDNIDFDESCNICRGNRLHYNSLPSVFVDEIEVDLTYNSILKIPDWYHHLSPLEDIIDQSTGTIREIATMVFKG